MTDLQCKATALRILVCASMERGDYELAQMYARQLVNLT